MHTLAKSIPMHLDAESMIRSSKSFVYTQKDTRLNSLLYIVFRHTIYSKETSDAPRKSLVSHFKFGLKLYK